MAIESTIYSRLSGFAGLTALVGTRIYPMILPQGATYPAVTYQRIATAPRDSCMSEDDGIVRANIQVTAWSETFTNAKAIVDQVRAALQRYTVAGIQGIYVIAEYDLFDDEVLKYGASMDFEVVYEEVV